MSSPEKKKGLFAAAAHLTGHIFVGAIMFGIVAVAAGMLDLLVKYFEEKGVNETIVTVLGYVEKFVFFLDVACFVVMLLAATYKFACEIWREVSSE